MRKERQLALAKLNKEFSARDQKLKAREQEQANLARVLKTIEETLARQAREAEAARQQALLAEREQQSRSRQKPPAAARWSAPAPALAGHLPKPVASCPGRSMAVWSPVTAPHVAAMPAPTGTAC